ncbi:MAG: S-layer homology domain-containing protein [Defluviitaleaceae bacterium]|nr:S-layer homology domain-containing protein [Defluviitaleaceae bacterium]
MKKKNLSTFLLAFVVLISGLTFNVQAADFRDVGTTWEWASEAIGIVSDLGIMTGDLSGNFNPNDNIDKFETARILARMDGFNPANLTPAQRDYHEQIFQSRLPIIRQYSSQFSRWGETMNVDREIAYLLYRGILFPTDLEQFIVVVDGVQRFRALMREELAVFLVRLMNRTQQAYSAVGIPNFNDHAQITPSARAYVYYLRSLNIMNGTDNVVNPRSTVNRAAMASMAVAALREINSPLFNNNPLSGTANINNNTNNPTNTINNPTNNNNTELVAVNGSVAGVYPSFRAILVTSTNPSHNNRIFTVSAGSIITINDLNRTFADLQPNMNFAAIMHNNEIVSINATGTLISPPTTNPQPGSGNPAPTPTPAPTPLPNLVTRTLHGTVINTSFTSTSNMLNIETRILSHTGDIISETQAYTIASNAQIYRAGVVVSHLNIAQGDLIIADVSFDGVIHRINLEERDRHIFGTLIEKNFSENSLMPSLVVRDASGVNHNFNVDSTTRINRQNMGNINSRGLRVGDSVEIRGVFNMAHDIFARGSRSSADVYIRSIFISGREQNHIIVGDSLSGSADRKHLIIDNTVDIHSLSIGSWVRIWMDSDEIEAVTVLQEASGNNFTGFVTGVNLSNSTISVRDANFNTRVFTFDNSTTLYNSITNRSEAFSTLEIGRRVFVITTSGTAAVNNNRATSVVIIPN